MQPKIIDHVIRGLPFCFAYLDVLLVTKMDTDDHKQHLNRLSSRLQEYDIVINIDKTQFGVPEPAFLGRLIDVFDRYKTR